MRKKNNQKATNLTVKEVAKQIRYSTGAVTRFIRKRQLSAYKPGGGRKYLITQEAVDEFLRRSNLKRKRKVTPEVIEEYAYIDNVLKKKEHCEDLARIATQILGGLGHIHPVGKNHYKCYGSEKQFEFNKKILTRSELIDWLQTNMIATHNQNETLFNSFLTHLKAENREYENLYQYLVKSPEELLRLLQTLELRKTFKGTCEVCRGLK